MQASQAKDWLLASRRPAGAGPRPLDIGDAAASRTGARGRGETPPELDRSFPSEHQTQRLAAELDAVSQPYQDRGGRLGRLGIATHVGIAEDVIQARHLRQDVSKTAWNLT
jgi:hypothetical protein